MIPDMLQLCTCHLQVAVKGAFFPKHCALFSLEDRHSVLLNECVNKVQSLYVSVGAEQGCRSVQQPRL